MKGLRCIFLAAAFCSLLAGPVPAATSATVTMPVYCYSRTILDVVVGNLKARRLRARYTSKFICGAAPCRMFERSHGFKRRCKFYYVAGID